jgi:hypothetical protein
VLLVNPCRPWLGAAVGGNPQVPASLISQFRYAEQLIGHPMDIFHDYHPPGTPLLNSTETFLAKHGTYVYAGWEPAARWAAADGHNAAVNAAIDQAAASIKAVAPHKVFLTLWQEPQRAVSGGTSCLTRKGATAGTPAQYRAMWRNVEERFHAAGVTNVIWVIDYSGTPQWTCLVAPLWPGNDLVDWVTYDSYSTSYAPTWGGTVGWFYNFLRHHSTRATDFAAKPWGVAEFGDCRPTYPAQVGRYYRQAARALAANTYPRLKMYLIFDNSLGPHSGPGCLTNYATTGAYDPAKQRYFNVFANSPVFTNRAG